MVMGIVSLLVLVVMLGVILASLLFTDARKGFKALREFCRSDGSDPELLRLRERERLKEREERLQRQQERQRERLQARDDRERERIQLEAKRKQQELRQEQLQIARETVEMMELMARMEALQKRK